jgi:putative transposase
MALQYRRLFAPGGCYFFTLVTAQRRHIFSDDAAIRVLRESFLQVMAKRPFSIDAFVLLPDHLHCIWTLPPDDCDFATCWRLIKTWFTKHYQTKPAHASDITTPQKGHWQPRYWEHLLRDDIDFQHHIDYIHYNPVKHGYAQRPLDWPHSSLQRYVAMGIYPGDWGGNNVPLPENIGGE